MPQRTSKPRHAPMAAKRTGNRFLDDPGLANLLADDDDNYSSDAGGDGTAQDSGSDDNFAEEPSSNKRKRRTQKILVVQQETLRPLDQPPPKLMVRRREMRKLGAVEVLAQEKDKLDPLHDKDKGYDRNIEKHSRYISRTDGRIYHKEEESLGIALSDDGDKNNAADPVKWDDRDPALRAAQTIDATLKRTAARSAGRMYDHNSGATPMTTAQIIESYPFIPGPRRCDQTLQLPKERIVEDQFGLVSTWLDHQIEPSKAYLPKNGGIEHHEISKRSFDQLFEEIEDIENRVSPDDVVAVANQQELDDEPTCRQELHIIRHSGPHQCPANKIHQPSWAVAKRWATILRDEHDRDLFMLDGKLDEEYILATKELPLLMRSTEAEGADRQQKQPTHRHTLQRLYEDLRDMVVQLIDRRQPRQTSRRVMRTLCNNDYGFEKQGNVPVPLTHHPTSHEITGASSDHQLQVPPATHDLRHRNRCRRGSSLKEGHQWIRVPDNEGRGVGSMIAPYKTRRCTNLTKTSASASEGIRSAALNHRKASWETSAWIPKDDDPLRRRLDGCEGWSTGHRG